MTATACPRCLSKTVTVFAPELETKPAWSAIGFGGATAENTGLNAKPSAIDSWYRSASQNTAPCSPVTANGASSRTGPPAPRASRRAGPASASPVSP